MWRSTNLYVVGGETQLHGAMVVILRQCIADSDEIIGHRVWTLIQPRVMIICVRRQHVVVTVLYCALRVRTSAPVASSSIARTDCCLLRQLPALGGGPPFTALIGRRVRKLSRTRRLNINTPTVLYGGTVFKRARLETALKRVQNDVSELN